MSYVMVSISSALWAGGAPVVGLSFVWVVHQIGRHKVLWICVALTSLGSIILGSANSLVLVFSAVTILGTAGTMLQIVASAVLSDHHGKRREKHLLKPMWSWY